MGKPKYPKIRSKKDDQVHALALAAMAPAAGNPWSAGNANPLSDIRDLAAQMWGPKKFTPEEWDAMTPQEQNKEALKRLRDYNEGVGTNADGYFNPTHLMVPPTTHKDMMKFVQNKTAEAIMFGHSVTEKVIKIDDIEIKKLPKKQQFSAEEWEKMTPAEQNKEALKNLRDGQQDQGSGMPPGMGIMLSRGPEPPK